MRQLEIKTLFKECSIDELNALDKALVTKAKEATFTSYSPYSKFNVGAAILLDNGEIISGSNQENAAYPSGLCAERTALFYASSSHPNIPIRKLAIAARPDNGTVGSPENGFQKKPVSPCGGCRQALIEYEHHYGSIEVILYGTESIYIFPSVASLLPLSFTEF